MIAKLIAHAPTREAAIDRLAHALDRTVIAGVRSNVAFLDALCRAPVFRQGKVDTAFIDRNLAELGAVRQSPDRAAAALGVVRLVASDAGSTSEVSSEPYSPWEARDGFQLGGGTRSITLPIVIDGENAVATVTFGKAGANVTVDETVPATDAKVFAAGEEVFVVRGGRQTRVRLKDVAAAASAETDSGDGVVRAPMHGRLLELFVHAGDRVAAGQRLAIIEAMKMEHTLRAPLAGVVVRVSASAGTQVVEDGEIMVIGPVAEG
jgi:3-methylcrotonyl-CoA carboxylase alpha subunit